MSEAIEYVEYNRGGERVDFFCAPDIIKRPKPDGGYEYWLFYCNSSYGERTSYLGMAKAESIEGPYRHSHEILRTHQDVGGTPNAIDPAVYLEEVDGEERMYLPMVLGRGNLSHRIESENRGTACEADLWLRRKCGSTLLPEKKT